MLAVLEVAAILFCTILCIHPLKKILSGASNILHFCTLSFWTVQVIPLIIKQFLGIDAALKRYPKTFIAMNDETTCFVYAFFVIIVEFMLDIMSRTLPCSYHSFWQVRGFIQRIVENKLVKGLLLCGMFTEAILVAFSPEPSIYFHFSHFYTNTVNRLTPEYIYHASVMSIGNRVAFFCIILFYYLTQEPKGKWITYVAIAVMTWVNGKRTLMAIALLAVLIIDFLRASDKSERIKLVKKTLVVGIIIVGYFKLYSDITGKFSSTSFNYQYSIYFGRMSNVDACIYAELNDEAVLAYRGQSILYDLLFWIPRAVWNTKPVLYSKYFTAYVMGYKSININWQFQTNIWSEYFSNFSFMGPFLGIIVLYFIAYLSQKSKNMSVYIIGLVFAVMYTMYGFEALVQSIGAIWVLMLILSRIRRIDKS